MGYGVFLLVDFVHNAAVNIGVQICACTFHPSILWGYNPRNKVDGSHGNSFKFLKNGQTFPQWQCHFISPLSVHEGSSFSMSSSILVVFHCFDNCHTDECEVVSHLLLVCISLMTNDDPPSTVALIDPLFLCLLWRSVCLDPLPIFELGCFFLSLRCRSSLCILKG